jgi:hypothetical protein
LALAEGYWNEAREFLTAAEKAQLVFVGRLITFETGLRFLTDFLAGDVYIRVSRPEQNLERCRTQFKLVASIEAQEKALAEIIRRL